MRMLVTASFEETGLSRLRRLGEVLYRPWTDTRQLLSGSQLIDALESVDILITEADNVGARELTEVNQLQLICSCRGNPVNIDVAAATAKGIPVIHAPGRNADAVADLTVALMVMLARKILRAVTALRDPEIRQSDPHAFGRLYLDLRGIELWNKTVGIVGLGAVGRKVAERIRGFGSRLVIHDPFVSEDDVASYGGEKVALETLLREADLVTLHVMPNASNRGMIGARELGLMKETAYFINTARSALTDEQAIVTALRQRKIAGAGLDVFDREPLPLDHPFFELDNVILLPHIGGNTYEVALHQSDLIVPDVERIVNGQPPRNCVNPEVLTDFHFRS